ncbi:hypothetical protein V6N11_082978 [Hibiscus sabdariffa]|uniref:Uncharacterized protein n=1 Tax=Hibiscus sabdariffa TaxID=183260 RepID=A0ABR2QKV3_9ROSI
MEQPMHDTYAAVTVDDGESVFETGLVVKLAEQDVTQFEVVDPMPSVVAAAVQTKLILPLHIDTETNPSEQSCIAIAAEKMPAEMIESLLADSHRTGSAEPVAETQATGRSNRLGFKREKVVDDEMSGARVHVYLNSVFFWHTVTYATALMCLHLHRSIGFIAITSSISLQSGSFPVPLLSSHNNSKLSLLGLVSSEGQINIPSVDNIICGLSVMALECFALLFTVVNTLEMYNAFKLNVKGMKRKVAPRSQGEMGFDSNMNEALSTAFGEEDDEETCDEE